MIERYSSKIISSVWSDEYKFHIHSVIEIAHLFEMMNIDKKYLKIAIEEYCGISSFDIKNIRMIEAETKHETVAFIKFFTKKLELMLANRSHSGTLIREDYVKKVHYGLTSSDLLDNTSAIQILRSINILADKIDDIVFALEKKSSDFSDQMIMGRTHGMIAEQMPLSKIFDLHRQELLSFCKNISDKTLQMKIRGPVGERTNITLDQEVSIIKYVSDHFDISAYKIPKIVCQVTGRDDIARVFLEIAVLSSVIERFVTNIRLYSRTECGEITEGFADGQFGSSAMPHKRNPIISENIVGLSRMIRGFVSPLLENISLWHERDMTHSSVERIAFEDIFQLIYHMLSKELSLIENLSINKEAIDKNCNIIDFNSQSKMNSLINSGLSRFEAYDMVKFPDTTNK